jgi:hypothetical protein
MFSVKNAVRVALMQTGVIVAGVLAAGTSMKVWRTLVGPDTIPAATVQLLSFGPLALAIPLVWIGSVLVLRQRADVSDGVKALSFGSGVIILIALVIGIGIVIFHPWLNVPWGVRPEE